MAAPRIITNENIRRYWTISQVARECSITTSTIRFWETDVFKGFFRATNYSTLRGGIPRKYDRKNREVIRRIVYLLRVEGYTIKGAIKQLENG